MQLLFHRLPKKLKECMVAIQKFPDRERENLPVLVWKTGPIADCFIAALS
jgi:hypothetical protein